MERERKGGWSTGSMNIIFNRPVGSTSQEVDSLWSMDTRSTHMCLMLIESTERLRASGQVNRA